VPRVDFFCARTPRPFGISRVVLTLELKSLNGSQSLIALQPFFIPFTGKMLGVRFISALEKKRRRVPTNHSNSGDSETFMVGWSVNCRLNTPFFIQLFVFNDHLHLKRCYNFLITNGTHV
jgi:hypothetical protein